MLTYAISLSRTRPMILASNIACPPLRDYHILVPLIVDTDLITIGIKKELHIFSFLFMKLYDLSYSYFFSISFVKFQKGFF